MEFKIGDTVRIVQDSAMSVFGYPVGQIFEVYDISLNGHLNIDKNRPLEYWKPWRFEKI